MGRLPKYTQIMENHIEINMESDMEAGVTYGPHRQTLHLAKPHFQIRRPVLLVLPDPNA